MQEPPVTKRTTSQADDSDEELYKFFEDNVSPEVEKKPRLTRGRTEDKSDKSSEKKTKKDDKRRKRSSGRGGEKDGAKIKLDMGKVIHTYKI